MSKENLSFHKMLHQTCSPAYNASPAAPNFAPAFAAAAAFATDR